VELVVNIVVHTKEYVQTKEENCLKESFKEKDFEMSVVELLDCNILLVCIYRAPGDGHHLFIKNLEIVIQKVQLKRKRVILLGIWSIHFMEDSVKLQELK
jgi:CRISPR/Cas system CMR subunit Cmr6 (Cas7 group RAMP superfamily)